MLWIHRNLNLPRRGRLRERDRNCEPEVPEFPPKNRIVKFVTQEERTSNQNLSPKEYNLQ